MEWLEILLKRSQTFIFDNVEPPKNLLEQIINEIHSHVPVKQNELYYSIEIFDYSNKELRKAIYQTTKTNYSDKYRYNPQVLAPWLVVFKENHNLVNKNIGYHVERNNANLQIGMAAMFIALSAIDKGLSAGFCQCVTDRDQLNKLIGEDVILLMGIGYESKEDNYYCLIDEIYKPRPKKYESKPNKEKYIKWI